MPIRSAKLSSQRIPVLLKEGKGVAAAWGYIKYLPVEEYGWQVIVPQSVAKKATERNYLKRRLREAVRKSTRSVPAQILVVAKPQLTKTPQSSLTSQLDALLQKIGEESKK